MCAIGGEGGGEAILKRGGYRVLKLHDNGQRIKDRRETHFNKTSRGAARGGEKGVPRGGDEIRYEWRGGESGAAKHSNTVQVEDAFRAFQRVEENKKHSITPGG